MTTEVSTLTQLIENEVIQAMGLPIDSWIGKHLRPFLDRATRHFSEMFAECDRLVAQQGLSDAARYLLSNLVSGFETRGVENIPREGPLVIASNHPGTVDSITLIAAAQRSDLKVVAGDIPFLLNLPNVSKHLIFTSYFDTHNRMAATRESIRHLRAGGSILLFADGNIDPDPSFMPHPENELPRWSRSLEIFLRNVPQTQVITSIVSNVIDPRYMRHPITWLRRARPDRQRLATMIQVIQQMLGKKLDLVPRVSFGELLKLQSIGCSERALQVIVDSAKRLMQIHINSELASPLSALQRL